MGSKSAKVDKKVHQIFLTSRLAIKKVHQIFFPRLIWPRDKWGGGVKKKKKSAFGPQEEYHITAIGVGSSRSLHDLPFFSPF